MWSILILGAAAVGFVAIVALVAVLVVVMSQSNKGPSND
jgi:hypothetical protein